MNIEINQSSPEFPENDYLLFKPPFNLETNDDSPQFWKKKNKIKEEAQISPSYLTYKYQQQHKKVEQVKDHKQIIEDSFLYKEIQLQKKQIKQVLRKRFEGSENSHLSLIRKMTQRQIIDESKFKLKNQIGLTPQADNFVTRRIDPILQRPKWQFERPYLEENDPSTTLRQLIKVQAQFEKIHNEIINPFHQPKLIKPSIENLNQKRKEKVIDLSQRRALFIQDISRSLTKSYHYEHDNETERQIDKLILRCPRLVDRIKYESPRSIQITPRLHGFYSARISQLNKSKLQGI